MPGILGGLRNIIPLVKDDELLLLSSTECHPFAGSSDNVVDRQPGSSSPTSEGAQSPRITLAHARVTRVAQE